MFCFVLSAWSPYRLSIYQSLASILYTTYSFFLSLLLPPSPLIDSGSPQLPPPSPRGSRTLPSPLPFLPPSLTLPPRPPPKSHPPPPSFSHQPTLSLPPSLWHRTLGLLFEVTSVRCPTPAPSHSQSISGLQFNNFLRVVGMAASPSGVLRPLVRALRRRRYEASSPTGVV